MLQCVAVCCSVLQETYSRPQQTEANFQRYHLHIVLFPIIVILLRHCTMLQRVAACCSVLQCVAVCCSVLQCVVLYVSFFRDSGDRILDFRITTWSFQVSNLLTNHLSKDTLFKVLSKRYH